MALNDVTCKWILQLKLQLFNDTLNLVFCAMYKEKLQHTISANSSIGKGYLQEAASAIGHSLCREDLLPKAVSVNSFVDYDDALLRLTCH